MHRPYERYEMKLRNKKTGMIGEVGYLASSSGEIIVNNINDQDEWHTYDSLTELNEEWEDYEEPKVYYYISDFGAIHECEIGKFLEDEEDRKRIGNYFEIREDAERALEKLKAWQRLKDNGISFSLDIIKNERTPYIKLHSKQERVTFKKVSMITRDLMLIFGSED